MPEERVDDFSTVDQAMGNPPKWIVYWGISVIFIFLIVLLVIAALIQYPDQIRASATIYLERPPVAIFAKDGSLEIDEILIENNANVREGEILMTFKSEADWKTVLELKENLDLDNLSNAKLGELTPVYQQLLKSKQLLDQEIKTDISAQKVLQLKAESSQIKALNQSLAEQIELYKHELDNVQKEYDRAVSLQASGVISLEELEQKENKLLQQKRSLSQLEAQVINNRISLSRLDKNILELNANTSNAFFKLDQELEQQQKALLTAIEAWEKQYLVRASIDGRIVLPLSTQPGSMPDASLPMLTILPESSTPRNAIAEAKVKANGLGKLQKEQTAQIYFEHYPAAEYGILKAKVASISVIPQEENYLIQLELPQQWVTDYGVEIPRQQSMPVEVAIQTKNYSLLKRVFSGLIDAIKH
jgi:multidrug resistance efflux pump